MTLCTVNLSYFRASNLCGTKKSYIHCRIKLRVKHRRIRREYCARIKCHSQAKLTCQVCPCRGCVGCVRWVFHPEHKRTISHNVWYKYLYCGSVDQAQHTSLIVALLCNTLHTDCGCSCACDVALHARCSKQAWLCTINHYELLPINCHK